ncbi:Oidioi.mRNA.OKI2018_I69.PAR.g9292.t1.cds [Oikopleura dioica]|uniref:Oidioi.mRNA.OKI2018_I69.PAR.g9292.t1.cds n=1 Tax=Oikopleura dioica TaxID=34765 RepID=A0ABN7RP26_OIKDI|nr:Oidioi.mRNA.OKI2018_I69.PAR.g9292.t1.cds [Oikopleura dioica]
MKKNGGEVTKFADYAKERIWRKNLDKFTLKIQLPNEEKREYRFGPNVVVHDVVKSICDELGITIAEIYGLQRVPGSTEWLNGRNRLELQIQEQEELLYIRQKYFPDVSLLTSKEKEFLLRQIEQDFRLGRNGQQTIPESFFAEFAAKVESSHKPLPEQEANPAESFGCSAGAPAGSQGGTSEMIINREGLIFPQTPADSVKYHEIYGVSKMKKVKQGIRILLIDEDKSTRRQMDIILDSPRTAKATFRFISECYVFYSFDQVPLYMLEGQKQDLGIQILDLFNPKQGRNYKTFQFDSVSTKAQLDLRHRKRIRNGQELVKNERGFADLVYKIMSDLTCHICFDRSVSVILRPCNHQLMCQDCAEKCSECPLCLVKIEEVSVAFLSRERKKCFNSLIFII